MGVFRVRAKVFRLSESNVTKEVEFIVDTGATFPVIPRATAQELAISPIERRSFTLADGRSVDRDIGWAGIAYDGQSAPVRVVIGERDDPALLGALALEALGLEVDPVSRTLRPATLYLLATQTSHTKHS